MSAESEGVGGDQGSRRVKVVGTANEEKEMPEGGRRMQWTNSPPVPRTQVAGQSGNAGVRWAGSCVLQSHLDLSDCVS